MIDAETRYYIKHQISERKKREMALDNEVYLSITGTQARGTWSTRTRPDAAYVKDLGRRTPCVCGVAYRSSKVTPGCPECGPRLKARRERDRIRKQEERFRKRERAY